MVLAPGAPPNMLYNGNNLDVLRRHLHRNNAEFEYRYNTRRLYDGARVELAVKKADGKRLVYG